MYELKTPRLHLIPFQEDELHLFHALNSNAYIRKYLWDDQVISLETAKEALAQNKLHFEQDRYGIWKIKLTKEGEVIGFVGLWFFFDEAQPQLIYGLLEKFSGQGFATEAAGCLIDYAFNALGFEYLMAAMDEPHMASQNVAKRAGKQYIETKIENKKPTVFYRIDKQRSS